MVPWAIFPLWKPLFELQRRMDSDGVTYLFSQVEYGTFVPKKGVCCRAHVLKWVALQWQQRNARCMQADYCCSCSVVHVHSRVYSQPSAFTSRREATSWLVLISRHAPCNKLPFLVRLIDFVQKLKSLQAAVEWWYTSEFKFHFRLIPPEYYRVPAKRQGFLKHLSVPGKDAVRESWYVIPRIEMLGLGSCSRSAKWAWDRPDGGCHTNPLPCWNGGF